MQPSKGAPQTGQRLERWFRAATPAKVDPASRTVTFSFSSETPVDRWFGDEVLSHAPGAADLSRLGNGAPLLFNHDWSDVIGVVETAEIAADRRGYATVRLAKTQRGEEVLGMIDDGILQNVSFAYVVSKYVPAEKDADGDNDCYIATEWQPYEISIVAVPADQSVGIGRSHNLKKENRIMNQNEQSGTGGENLSRGQRRNHASGAELERARIMEITALCQKHNQRSLGEQLIADGVSIESARAEVLERITSRPQQAIAATAGGPSLGLTDGEVRQFSIVRAISAQLRGDWRGAGFERECSVAAGQKLGRETTGFFVPTDVQERGNWGTRAAYQVGTAVQGGNLVATNLLAGSFIEALRNEAQVMAAGATILSGLVGKVDVPRRPGVTNTYWVAESAAITESEATFDKVSLTPKTLGALSKMSRLMLLQGTPGIEQITRSDLVQQIALAIDLAAISGSGSSGQPTGIVNTAGVGSVVGGANGANITFDHLIALETALANSNAPWDTRGYLLNSKTIGSLKTLKSSTGQYLWTDSPPGQRSGTPLTFNGYPASATNQLRSTLTKGSSSGVCSEIVFGAWSELLIGEWGVLEILVNPFDATGFPAGDVLIRAMQTLDIAVRHAQSFAVMSDALTP